MLDKMKGFGNQLTTKASETAEGLKSSMKSGVESLTDAATDAAATLNEKAIRRSVDQLRTIIQVATDELKARPLAGTPATMTASVTIAGVALEIEVVLPGSIDKATSGLSAEQEKVLPIRSENDKT